MLGGDDSCEQLRSKYEKFLMTLKVPKNGGFGDCMTQAYKSTMNKNYVIFALQPGRRLHCFD